jgi:hypothetical protein
MATILVMIGLVLTCTVQAICSSLHNRGGPYGWYVFILGIGISVLWVLLAKYSTSLLRDGLIWDVLIALVYSIIFVTMGHGSDFTLKHWIGLGLTFGVFLYWTVIK